jgi:hypothetical protein
MNVFEYDKICEEVKLNSLGKWESKKQIRHHYHRHYHDDEIATSRDRGSIAAEKRFLHLRGLIQYIMGPVVYGWVREITDIVSMFLSPVPYFFFERRSRAVSLSSLDSRCYAYSFQWIVPSRFGFSSNLSFDGGTFLRFYVFAAIRKSIDYHHTSRQFTLIHDRDRLAVADLFDEIYSGWATRLLRSAKRQATERSALLASIHLPMNISVTTQAINQKQSKSDYIETYVIVQVVSIADSEKNGVQIHLLLESFFNK